MRDQEQRAQLFLRQLISGDSHGLFPRFERPICRSQQQMNKKKRAHIEYRTYLNLHSRFRFLHLLQGISPQHLVFEAVQASQDFLSSPRVPRLQPSVGSAPTLSLRKIISWRSGFISSPDTSLAESIFDAILPLLGPPFQALTSPGLEIRVTDSLCGSKNANTQRIQTLLTETAEGSRGGVLTAECCSPSRI